MTTPELTPEQLAVLCRPGPTGYAVIAPDGFVMTTPDHDTAKKYEKAMHAFIVALVFDLAPLPEA